MPSLVDTKIATCSSWDDFVELTNSQKTSKDKGDLFERLTQVYLTVTPSYQSKLKHVWLLGNDELPEAIRKKLNLPSRDEGIDLVCETYNGEYWSVQCKYKSDQNRPLNHKELATFTSVSFNTSNSISLGLVVHTSTKKVKKSELMPNVTEIGLERWLSLSDEEWKRIVDFCKSNRLKPPRKRKPRAHQKQAIKDSAEHFVRRKQNRGKLIMPCGTGKSLTAFWIAQELKSKSIIVAVPSLALIKQSLEDWTAEFLADGIKPEWLVICSDESVGATGDADSTVASVYETGIPTNPSDAELDAFLKKKAKAPKIIFTTYQSAEKLTEAASRTSVTFDLLIADEAHKTVGRKDKSFAALLFEENIKIKKRLFMTATERVYNAAKDDVISMDDDTIYGSTCHQLSFKKAIDAKIICDYKIVTISVSESEIQTLIENQEKLLVTSGNIKFDTDAQSLAAGLAVNKAFKKYAIKHALTFHSSIKRARDFCEQQDNLPSTIDVVNSHISSKNSAGERARLLKAFAEEDYSLISNARCLTEGVDIKAIDCVTFVDPKKSTVDIVQATGRTMRQSKETNKECGYIILPLLIKDGESLEDIKSSDRFSEVTKIITILSTQDERIKEELKQTKNTKSGSGTRIIIDEDLDELLDVELSQIQASLRTVIWQKVGRFNWMSFHEARNFVRKLNLTSQTEWFKYTKSPSRPFDLPTNPNTVYKTNGWKSFGDWLGTGRIATRDFKYPNYLEAREFVHKLNLRGYEEWYKWKTSGKRPDFISGNPDRTYKNIGWKSYSDWLGYEGIIKHRSNYQIENYQSFSDAREYVRSLGLKNLKEWSETRKQPSFPKDIPKNPGIYYKDKGWINLGDWLGTFTINPKNKEYASYEDASKFAQSLSLKSSLEWRKYSKYNKLPENIPSNPSTVYKDKGWKGFGDFLGTGNVQNGAIDYLSFEQAKQFVQGLGLNSASEWRIFSKSSARPNNIPGNPNIKYKNSGWMSWQDFLGYQEISKFIYEEAVEYISKFKFSSSTEFFKEARAENLDEAMPRSPDVFYKHHGWKDWRTFLGTNAQIIRNRNYFSYAEAKNILKTHKVRSSRTWKEFRKSPAFPEKIPADPPTFYKNDEWISWQDFLSREED